MNSTLSVIKLWLPAAHPTLILYYSLGEHLLLSG